ncbi:M1 family metallopeptidase [Frateuria aurantia]
MRLKLVTAIALALASIPFAASSQTQPAASVEAQTTTQLPRGVSPEHYALTITPHLEQMRFDGQAIISIEVARATDQITFNALDLTFAKASLKKIDGTVLDTAGVTVDANDQTATVHLKQPLTPGSYQLALDYSGKINTQPNGLFVINYVSTHGKRQALYTQFENSDARRFMPSWDEPAYKATFDLTAIVPEHEMAVSNMPAAQKRGLGHGLASVHFGQTPKMSSYLLFFGVGDFQRATTTSDGTEIGVITQQGKVDQAGFALQSAKAILHEYNQYFGIKYPLPKLDNIASPGSSQFFGAMENWGAIFTFEYFLLLDPSFSTQGDKEAVFDTAAHEMAHQWFGDLVTMRWWDDLWLNEGFASWMQGRTTARLHPEWHTSLQAVGVREGAMARDAIASTHPIVQHISTVEQAGEAFDTITYSKGESVIRMLESYVGAQAWRQGVHNYLLAHEHGNAVSDDLWRAVEATAGGKPVTAVAHGFTLQPGIPMIEVVSQQCLKGVTTVQLKQTEFTRDRPDKQPLHWDVPVTIQPVGGQAQHLLIDRGQASVRVPGCGAILINAGEAGYYRSLYTAAGMAAIRQQFAAVAPIDQLGLMGDTWAEGMAGRAPISQYLDLVDATPAQADPQVWANIAGHLSGLDDDYKDQPAERALLRRYAIAKLKPQLDRLGWTVKAGEPAPDTLLRTRLIGVLGSMGEPGVLSEARRRYAAQNTDPAALPAALRKIVMAVVAEHADVSQWNQIHAQARAETTPLIRDNLYRLLASSEDEGLARQALDLALTDEPGATNSAGMVSMVSFQHPDLAYDFALKHKAQLDGMIDGSAAAAFYPRVASHSTDPAMIGKLQSFADKYMAKGSRRSVDSAIDSIQYGITVRQQRLPGVTRWLQNHQP